MKQMFVTDHTFEKVVSLGAPDVDSDCDLITHVHNPSEDPVVVRVEVGLIHMAAYMLGPKSTRPIIDDGPLPVFAVRDKVRVVVSGDVVLTCALCDNDSTTATEFRLGNWLYKDGSATFVSDNFAKLSVAMECGLKNSTGPPGTDCER